MSLGLIFNDDQALHLICNDFHLICNDQALHQALSDLHLICNDDVGRLVPAPGRSAADGKAS